MFADLTRQDIHDICKFCQEVKEKPRLVEEMRRPGRIMQAIISRTKDMLKITEEEIEKLQRELREAEQDKKELETFLQSFGEEEG